MPSGCFGFQYPSFFKLVSSCGSLPCRSMPTDLFLWSVIDDLLLLSKLWTLFMPYSRLQHAPSATSETLGSITYYSATRVWISNTHLWRFWRCWSRHKCSTGSFAWVRGIVSALSNAAAEVRTIIRFLRAIAHLDISPNLFHKVDFSSLASCSRNLLPVLLLMPLYSLWARGGMCLATITFDGADNGGD